MYTRPCDCRSCCPQGVSLLDHLNSLAEKGRRMPEQDIWQVGGRRWAVRREDGDVSPRTALHALHARPWQAHPP